MSVTDSVVAEISGWVLRLDATRRDLAALREREAQEADCLLRLMSAAGIDEHVVRDRRAVVQRPVSLSIDAEVFRAACERARVARAAAEKAIAQRVSVTAARKLLGEAALESIARRRKGGPRVVIVSAARE